MINLIFFGLRNANGSPSCYMPLKALSPTPLYYPLLSHHLAAISMAAVYTDAVHIADGVIGLKQRSRDPTE